MNHNEAIALLTADGDLGVPCSRYGTRSSDCAEIAWRVAEIIQDATGTETTPESLASDMEMVVNDSDEVAYLLAEYGNDVERADWHEYAESHNWT
jgi:hypothetical protein